LQGFPTVRQASRIPPGKIHLSFFYASGKGSKVCFPSDNFLKKHRKEVNKISKLDDVDFVITGYTLEQAVEDGALAEIFKNRWQQLSGGKPIVATAHLFNEVSLAGLREIWNEFAHWRQKIMPTLPENERLFHTNMNEKTVWVIEDGAAFTLMYPEDY
jgi:hypothetical protein